ncbi:MAG: hypothetical protein WD076_01760 [Parvularculaceae bacterium]
MSKDRNRPGREPKKPKKQKPKSNPAAMRSSETFADHIRKDQANRDKGKK